MISILRERKTRTKQICFWKVSGEINTKQIALCDNSAIRRIGNHSRTLILEVQETGTKQICFPTDSDFKETGNQNQVHLYEMIRDQIDLKTKNQVDLFLKSCWHYENKNPELSRFVAKIILLLRVQETGTPTAFVSKMILV